MLLISFSGLVYCMDFLEMNIDWLEEKLKPLIEGECGVPFSEPRSGAVKAVVLVKGRVKILKF